MPDQPSARIFISYSRRDGAEFATDVRRQLEGKNFTIWQDLVALEGGRDWWSQIDAALRSDVLQHFVLVVTPAALESEVVHDEIRLARQEGKRISPVKGPGLCDLSKVPRRVGQLYDLDLGEHRTTLQRVLELPSTAKRVPMMVERPPADFVPRPAEFETLKRMLLDPASKDGVALRGTTGYGKTTLAKALAYDPDIEDAFFDGMLWVELGQLGRGHIVNVIADLIALLTGKPREFNTIDGARTALGEALSKLHILLVIDDVWHRADLMPFLHGGPKTARLITTRFAGELPDDVAVERIAAMKGGADGEAWQLLASGLPKDQVVAQKAELVSHAGRCHNWPQALRLANGFLRSRMGLSKHGEWGRSRVAIGQPASLAAAIKAARDGLDAKSITAMDPSAVRPLLDPRQRYDQRHYSVAAGMELNLTLLDNDSRVRFCELGVFPEDLNVPIGMAARLWAETAGLDRHDTEGLLVAYDDASLIFNLDFGRGTFRFHDSVREYLQDRAGPENIRAQHKRLVQVMDKIGQDQQTAAVEADYFYRYLPYHLAAADDCEKLSALLCDPAWLQAKLVATGSPQALIADYREYGTDRVHLLIEWTLQLTKSICGQDPRQLMPQLLGRLKGSHATIALAFLNAARDCLSRPAILTQTPSLTQPGVEMARLEGHRDRVGALCVLRDGRLASGSDDKTIRLWNLKTGDEEACLLGHKRPVTALCALENGLLASGSTDETIRLWDVTGNVEISCLNGGGGPVTALCLLPDGRLASSSDKMIRLWDLTHGTKTVPLRGHSGKVTSLCLTQHERLASGSKDKTIRLWNLQTFRLDASRKRHSAGVTGLAALTDGRLASTTSDGRMFLWDLRDGAETHFDQHSGWFTALCSIPGARLATGLYEGQIRLWSIRSYATTMEEKREFPGFDEEFIEAARLYGHSGTVNALCALPSGALASGSSDATIRLWDLQKTGEATRFPDHPCEVTALCVLPDGRVASGSGGMDSAGYADSVRLWDPRTGEEIASLGEFFEAVTALCALPDGRIAIGFADNKIRLWDLKGNIETGLIEGHSHPITALCMLPDGRVASCSAGAWQGEVLLWHPTKTRELARLADYDDVFNALCVLPDGQLAAGGSDYPSGIYEGAIRLWSPTGALVARLDGLPASVDVLCALSNDRVVSGGCDGKLRLWDVKKGCETTCLGGHARGIRAICLLPDGRIASAASDRTVRLWDIARQLEVARLEVDASVQCLVVLPGGRLVAGDKLGRLHWLEIIT